MTGERLSGEQLLSALCRAWFTHLLNFSPPGRCFSPQRITTPNATGRGGVAESAKLL